MIRNIRCSVLGVTLAVFWAAIADASVIWINSAGSNEIRAVDSTTGAPIKVFTPGQGNGRGIVVVANIVYFTVAGSNNVFKLDATTGTSLGVAFSIAGASGLSAISFDGTNFWVADYSGTKNAYLVSPTGAVLKTIVLANCTSFCDGLEFFNGKLISNRGDTQNPGIYDIYDLNGTVLTPAFITDMHGGGRGIAFDGTNFIVSSSGGITTYNGATGAAISTISPAGNVGVYEDVSVDFAQRSDTGAPIPTLSEWSFMLMALILVSVGVVAVHRQLV